MRAGLIILILLLIAPIAAFGQNRQPVKAAAGNSGKRTTENAARNSAAYYLEIYRADCCRLTDEEWLGIARRLRLKGVPAFFGTYKVIDYREEWRPATLTRTTSKKGMLVLGVFASSAAAAKALNRLPGLLPKNGDEFKGIEGGPTGDQQTWQIGMYQITGFKAREPVKRQKPRDGSRAKTRRG